VVGALLLVLRLLLWLSLLLGLDPGKDAGICIHAGRVHDLGDGDGDDEIFGVLKFPGAIGEACLDVSSDDGLERVLCPDDEGLVIEGREDEVLLLFRGTPPFPYSGGAAGRA